MDSEIVGQAILRVMALVVNADEAGRDDETAVLVGAYTEAVGRSITVEALESVLSEAKDDPAAVWAWLKDQGAALDPADKQRIVSAAVQVCMADAELQDEELALLTRLARTLQVPGADLRGIMNEVWRAEREAPL